MEEIFTRHIKALDDIIALFKADAAAAAEALNDEKAALELDSHSGNEYLAPALYNALASIRTSPEQERPTGQLIAAISDARDELEIIFESVKDI